MNGFEFLNNYISVSHETFELLSIYHDLLLKWQSTINLVGKDTIDDIWSRHFLDSLQLTKYLDSKERNIVDLGSGAGFPGMVLAIYGYSNIHLIESNTRKVAFLQEVARLTKTKVHIHNCRIEESRINNADIFISRACAPLDKLLQLIFRLRLKELDLTKSVPRETICLFHKGKNYSIEHEGALLNWRYNMVEIPSIVDTQSVILKLSNIKKV